MIWRGSLFLKYALPLVILVIGGLVVSGLVEIYFSYQENKVALARIQHEKAVAAALRIEQFVKELEHDLSWIAQMPWGPRGVSLDQRRLDSLRLLRQVPAITEVSHLDPIGHEQLRVSRLAMDVVGSNADFFRDPKFREPMAHKTYFSPVYFRKESEPYMTIAMAGSGEDAGVVAAEANLKFIWDVVSNLRVGKGGYAYVVDFQERLIAHPDISLVLKKTELATLPQVQIAHAASAARTSDTVEAIVGKDRSGSEVLSAYAVIAPLNWTVFVDLPIAEAFAPLYASIWRTVVLVFVGVAISLIASLFLVRRMVAPIHALRAGAARIGAGSLDHRIAVKSGDELQALGDEFNRMTERLQESYAGLERKVKERTRDLTEALEQQTATSEILQVISSSPTDLKPVLDAVAESAGHLCDGDTVAILRVDGDGLKFAAAWGPLPSLPSYETIPIRRDLINGRAILDRKVIHIPDYRSESDEEFGGAKGYAARLGFQAALAAPMLREDLAIGVILVERVEARAFSNKQIEMLKTFADQAVIAIENVRLFKELEERNKALTELLEQQTATSEILRVISQSQRNVQPVFEAIAANAQKLCEGTFSGVWTYDGELIHLESAVGFTPDEAEAMRQTFPRRPGHGGTNERAILTGAVVYLPDVLEDAEYELQHLAREIGFRSMLSVPMLKDSRPIGTIGVSGAEPGMFSPRQIAMLETFADQAVIAIENTRLFKELEERNKSLTEALEQQTATSEILRVISSSPTDLQPVLDAVVERAARLCSARDAVIFRVEGASLRAVKQYGSLPPVPGEGVLPISREFVSGRAVLDRQTIHVADILAEPEIEFAGGREIAIRMGYRTVIVAPMMREGEPIGVIGVWRTEVRPFSDTQIALLQTFADQAVIAIENVRLFTELQERLEQQTATSEILRVISSSPTDLQPVLDAVAESAARLCDASEAMIFRSGSDGLQMATQYGSLPTIRADERIPIRRDMVAGRAVIDRHIVHVSDLLAESDEEFAGSKAYAARLGHRTVLAAPMLREGESIGVIYIRRVEVRPFTDRQIELLKTFADQAVIAIENVRLFKELQARTEELAHSVEQLQALAEVSQAINSTLDLQELLSAIVMRAVELSSTDGGAIYEYDQASGEFRPRATHGFPQELVEMLLATPLRIGEGATGRAAATRAPVQIPDVQAEGAYSSPLQEATIRAGARAVLAVPLLREGRVLGGLVVSRNSVGDFPPDVVDLLQTFAAQSTLAIQNAHLFREIEQKSHELEVASQHKSQFLANMSHELRTPLNAILGYTELIVDGIYGKVPQKIRDVQERVQKSGRHLLGLINDVLDLSKIEAGQLVLVLSDYSFNDVVQTVITSVESLAAEKGLRLTADVAPDLPVGRADERRITQVLLNLVGNAIKFTDKGKVLVSVTVADGKFVVSVKDTGPGIAVAEQDRIFEEFRQVDSSSTRAKGGTGLGLAIAKRIVELHRGRIWVESAIGKGSNFFISIPVKADLQGGTS
ncbi:MAG: GAF domain-containing protein [Betaproteobacteria bacterium]|nr:GAF domain-containing protein [Betaproteobacteria bacterium]